MKSKVISLIFPMISLLLSLLIPIIRGDFSEMAFTFFLGAFPGGILPLLLATAGKTDTSGFIVPKVTIFAVFEACVLIMWTLDLWTGIFVILPIAYLAAEIVFALTRKASLKTKLCLIFSSLDYLYAGIVIDVYHIISDIYLGMF